jgi:hypothetical protein
MGYDPGDIDLKEKTVQRATCGQDRRSRPLDTNRSSTRQGAACRRFCGLRCSAYRRATSRLWSVYAVAALKSVYAQLRILALIVLGFAALFSTELRKQWTSRIATSFILYSLGTMLLSADTGKLVAS